MTLRMCGIKYKHKLYSLTPRNQNGKLVPRDNQVDLTRVNTLIMVINFKYSIQSGVIPEK